MQYFYKDLPTSKVATAQFKSVDILKAGDILVIEADDIPKDKRFLFDIMFTTRQKKLKCKLHRWRDNINNTEVYEFKASWPGLFLFRHIILKYGFRGMELPVYKLIIDPEDNTGVARISLVDMPAIEIDYQFFNQAKPLAFAATDEEQRIASGPAMVANLKIYRRDEQHGEHQVFFDADTIRQIVYKFFKQGNTSQVNLMHEQPIEGVYLVESFLIDSKRGINTPAGFDTLPDGSWFTSYRIENDQVWQQVKDGTFKGFSVEGMFQHVKEDEDEELAKEFLAHFEAERI